MVDDFEPLTLISVPLWISVFVYEEVSSNITFEVEPFSKVSLKASSLVLVVTYDDSRAVESVFSFTSFLLRILSYISDCILALALYMDLSL